MPGSCVQRSEAEGAATTADIQHTLAGPNLGGINHGLNERRQHQVELRGFLDPAFASLAIPVFDLG